MQEKTTADILPGFRRRCPSLISSKLSCGWRCQFDTPLPVSLGYYSLHRCRDKIVLFNLILFDFILFDFQPTPSCLITQRALTMVRSPIHNLAREILTRVTQTPANSALSNIRPISFATNKSSNASRPNTSELAIPTRPAGSGGQTSSETRTPRLSAIDLFSPTSRWQKTSHWPRRGLKWYGCVVDASMYSQNLVIS